MTDPSYDEISERARKLWQERGQPAGQDEDIWFQAEQELRRRPDLTSASALSAPEAQPKAKPVVRENGRQRSRSSSPESAPRSMARSSQGRL